MWTVFVNQLASGLGHADLCQPFLQHRAGVRRIKHACHVFSLRLPVKAPPSGVS